MSLFKIINTEIANEEKNRIFKNDYSMYLRVEEDVPHLTLLKYFKNNKSSECYNDVSVQCRGLVYDNELNEIRCFPPERANSYEDFMGFVGDNWGDVIVEDFIDGTMINVFYDKKQKKHLISTRSRIGAKCYWNSDKTFEEMFNEIIVRDNIDFTSMDLDTCYTFVLKYPSNRIVVKHTTPDIVLVCARKLYSDRYENLDLIDIQSKFKSLDMNINIPERFTFSTVEEMEATIQNQDLSKQGFVLKYNNYRTKIRNPQYIHVKSLKSNSPYLINTYLDLRKKRNVGEFLKHFEEYKSIFSKFREDIHQITYEIYNWYINSYKLKYYSRDSIPYQYKPHCGNLHKQYKKSVENKRKRAIVLKDVISYVNSLPTYSLVFIRNYYLNDKKNKFTELQVQQAE
tara:strand:+ start:389 stop:1585 length:1197 start_codon:yes stop_codon:yes gene_type:complete